VTCLKKPSLVRQELNILIKWARSDSVVA
jgi:hypothetical protein